MELRKWVKGDFRRSHIISRDYNGDWRERGEGQGRWVWWIEDKNYRVLWCMERGGGYECYWLFIYLILKFWSGDRGSEGFGIWYMHSDDGIVLCIILWYYILVNAMYGRVITRENVRAPIIGPRGKNKEVSVTPEQVRYRPYVKDHFVFPRCSWRTP